MKKKLHATYEKYDNELEFLTMKMNLLCQELEVYKKDYYRIMSYYRTKKNRGLITQEEYEYRANLFKFKGIQSNNNANRKV